MSFSNTRVQNVEGSSEWTRWTSGFHNISKNDRNHICKCIRRSQRSIVIGPLAKDNKNSSAQSPTGGFRQRLLISGSYRSYCFWLAVKPRCAVRTDRQMESPKKTSFPFTQPRRPLVATANQRESIEGRIYKLMGGTGVIHRRKVEGEGTHLVPRRLLQQTWKLQR